VSPLLHGDSYAWQFTGAVRASPWQPCRVLHLTCIALVSMATMQGVASHLHCPGVYDIVSWVKLPKVLGVPKVLTDSQFLPCPSLAELWESSRWGEIPTIVMDLPLKNLESSE
jgi:hypothetical protein